MGCLLISETQLLSSKFVIDSLARKDVFALYSLIESNIDAFVKSATLILQSSCQQSEDGVTALRAGAAVGDATVVEISSYYQVFKVIYVVFNE